MEQESVNLDGVRIHLPTRRGENRDAELAEFADQLLSIQDSIGFKLSSRGWCYQLEGLRIINKGQFNRAQKVINECREGFSAFRFCR